MFKARCVTTGLVGVLTIHLAAYAGAVVELVPDSPGPYLGGEVVTLEVIVHN